MTRFVRIGVDLRPCLRPRLRRPSGDPSPRPRSWRPSGRSWSPPGGGPRCCSPRSRPCSSAPWSPAPRATRCSATCRPPPRRRWSAGWPTGSPWSRCSGTRSACRSPTPRSSPSARSSSARRSASSSSRASSPATRWPSGCAPPTSAIAWPAGWPIPPTPTGWPATCSAAPSRSSTSSRTRPSTTCSSGSSASGSRRRRSCRWPGGPSAALTKEGRHNEVVDSALKGLDRYLDEHRDELHDALPRPGALVAARAPWRTGSSSGCSTALRAVLDDMAHDREHGLRQPARRCSILHVRRRAADLARAARAKGEQLTRDLLERPELRAWIASAWTDAKAAAARRSPPTPSRRCGSRSPRPSPPAATGCWPSRPSSPRSTTPPRPAARYVVEHFGGEINQLVATTIARWDGEETSERLELLLGPDLQFIRINGTVVGGAAGLGAAQRSPRCSA